MTDRSFSLQLGRKIHIFNRMQDNNTSVMIIIGATLSNNMTIIRIILGIHIRETTSIKIIEISTANNTNNSSLSGSINKIIREASITIDENDDCLCLI